MTPMTSPSRRCTGRAFAAEKMAPKGVSCQPLKNDPWNGFRSLGPKKQKKRPPDTPAENHSE